MQSASEVANLIGLYGEVDRIAAQEDRDDVRQALGNYFRGYQRRRDVAPTQSAVGWFDRFLIATEEQQLRRELRRPDVEAEREATTVIDAIDAIDDTLESLAESYTDPIPLAHTDDVPAPPPPSEPRHDPNAAVPESALPNAAEALAHFASTDPSPRDFSKRLLALTVLMRAYPDLQPGREQAHLVTAALVGASGSIAFADRAGELHVRLHTQFTSMGAWTPFIQGAMRDGLVDPDVMYLQEHVPPCLGDYDVKTDPLDPAKRVCAVEIETAFPVPIPFDRAIHYLYPTNWRVSSLWCVMSSYDASEAPYVELFDEEVSLECGNPSAWGVQTRLRFTFSRKAAMNGQPRRACAEYMLAEPVTPTSDIAVDEGYLKVIEDGNGIILKTKKVVRFTDPTLDGAQMAMLMCPLGYAAGVEKAILDATQPGLTVDPFPIGPDDLPKHPNPPHVVVPAGSMYLATAGAVTTLPGTGSGYLSSGTSPGGTPGSGPSEETPGEVMGATVDHYQQYLQETMADYQASTAKLVSGTYRIEDYYGDLSRMWGRGIKSLAALADVVQRAMALKAPPPYGAAASTTAASEEP